MALDLNHYANTYYNIVDEYQNGNKGLLVDDSRFCGTNLPKRSAVNVRTLCESMAPLDSTVISR
jgi:hypothetical protein